jgi:hypothetical protein
MRRVTVGPASRLRRGELCDSSPFCAEARRISREAIQVARKNQVGDTRMLVRRAEFAGVDGRGGHRLKTRRAWRLDRSDRTRWGDAWPQVTALIAAGVAHCFSAFAEWQPVAVSGDVASPVERVALACWVAVTCRAAVTCVAGFTWLTALAGLWAVASIPTNTCVAAAARFTGPFEVLQ